MNPAIFLNPLTAGRKQTRKKKMKVYNVKQESILQAGRACMVQIENLRPLNGKGTAYAFTLRPDKDTRDKETGFCQWQRVSSSWSRQGRKVWAVCYHGHKQFLRVLFEKEPSCRVVSSMATFDGQEDFLRNAWEVAEKNVGSIMYPISYGETCNCDS